ncbi:MAG: imidazoleglycerol-phosphate dehydratase HisB [Chloroflexi bacterium]|nr:imidazoleglycerol-phosphate dehydratase HisB [Chloroflexota bacterium]
MQQEGVRRGTYERTTGETAVRVTIALDGAGRHTVSTGVLFLDHMLHHIARHGLFDLDVAARGDVAMDKHHTVEDVAITLGRAFFAALDDGRGIVRAAHCDMPMDEALVSVAIDLSGRPYPVIDLGPHVTGTVGDMEADLARHFLESFAVEARCNLHVRVLRGVNAHHVVEATFKGLGRALDAASTIDARIAGQIPSTKGTLR